MEGTSVYATCAKVRSDDVRRSVAVRDRKNETLRSRRTAWAAPLGLCFPQTGEPRRRAETLCNTGLSECRRLLHKGEKENGPSLRAWSAAAPRSRGWPRRQSQSPAGRRSPTRSGPTPAPVLGLDPTSDPTRLPCRAHPLRRRSGRTPFVLILRTAEKDTPTADDTRNLTQYSIIPSINMSQ